MSNRKCYETGQTHSNLKQQFSGKRCRRAAKMSAQLFSENVTRSGLHSVSQCCIRRRWWCCWGSPRRRTLDIQVFLYRAPVYAQFPFYCPEGHSLAPRLRYRLPLGLLEKRWIPHRLDPELVSKGCTFHGRAAFFGVICQCVQWRKSLAPAFCQETGAEMRCRRVVE